MRITEVDINAIGYAGDRRPVNTHQAGRIADSIETIGLQSPIVIREAGADDNSVNPFTGEAGCPFALVSGAHRHYAFQMLGRDNIPAFITDLEGLAAELAEIDENLIRNELTALERGEHLARRKEVYEALYPETRRGGDYGNQYTGGQERLNDIVSFSQSTADSLGTSRRTVERDVKIATDIAPDVRDLLHGTPLENRKTDLLKLARMKPAEQREVVRPIVEGQASKLSDVTRALTSSESNEWYTPKKYVEAARQVMGGIDTDPASNDTAQEWIQAGQYFTAETDGLVQEWTGRVWLNPPYGGMSAPFVQKLFEEVGAGRVSEAVVLVNANSTETRWFAPLWDHTLCFTEGRINFFSPSGSANGSTHGSVFIYIGPNKRRFYDEFAQWGYVVERVRYDD